MPTSCKKTMYQKKEGMEKGGPWHYATISKEDTAQVWADTWHATEYALREVKVVSTCVPSFTVKHLETLKKAAMIWPPAVNWWSALHFIPGGFSAEL
eukprot:4916089-Ditylum_brightwellii.AAC.2